VEVSRAEARYGGRVVGTGAYDLRLFRVGQLVGRYPDPATEPDPATPAGLTAWRDATRIPLDPRNGTATRTFRVRLPGRATAGPVEFTAYAFNEDRIKSPNATATYDAPAAPPRTR